MEQRDIEINRIAKEIGQIMSDINALVARNKENKKAIDAIEDVRALKKEIKDNKAKIKEYKEVLDTLTAKLSELTEDLS